MKIKINKGLDLTITGAAKQQVDPEFKKTGTIALIGGDYPCLRAKLLVQKGERVKQGQPLFLDKNSQVYHTSPIAGIVNEINFGQKRALQSIVIKLDGDEAVTYQHFDPEELSKLNTEVIIENLVASGLWTALRTRPYGKTPNPNSFPHSIFITGMDGRFTTYLRHNSPLNLFFRIY